MGWHGQLPSYAEATGGRVIQPLREQGCEHFAARELLQGLGGLGAVRLQSVFLWESGGTLSTRNRLGILNEHKPERPAAQRKHVSCENWIHLLGEGQQ